MAKQAPRDLIAARITHEFGHVKFRGRSGPETVVDDLLDRRPHANKAVSKWDNILNAPQSDWMEWQAGYISGALLIPVNPLPLAADP